MFQLDAQNEQLRKQNVKCTAQLQVLKSCAERTKSWRNSLLLSRSVTVSRSSVRRLSIIRIRLLVYQ